ncbi:MAG TPA: hypothetical protein VIH03_05360 [Nitrososphaerales archaeon]
MAKAVRNDFDKLIKLYRLYDSHRVALLWFLQGMDASSYDEYRKNYH